MACSSECVFSPPSDGFVSQRTMYILYESHTQSILGLAVEIATAQPCVHHATKQFFESRRDGSLQALRSVRRVHTAITDGCKFWCWCIVTEHLVAAMWQFVTTMPKLAMRMQRRCAGGHMPARLRRATVTCLRQTRHTRETAQSAEAVDVMSGEEGSGDTLGCPHSSIQTSLRRLQRLNTSSPARARDGTNSGSCPKLRMPCVRLNILAWHESHPCVKSSLLTKSLQWA